MTLTTQFYTMLAMIGMGSFLGASLDTYRHFLNRQEMMRWVVFINDLIFWIVQGLLTFYVLLIVNEGILRFYIFLAILCGFAAYQSLFRKFYLKSLYFFIHFITSIYHFFRKMVQLFILKPITVIVSLMITMMTGLLLFLWRMIKWTSQIIWKLCKILLAPLFWILKQLWGLFPSSLRIFVKKNFVNIRGFFYKVKKLIGNLYRFWNDFFHKK
ncbi:spore cortex biosynthesis protein YabQ [Bacillus sp. FJAT-47783]|uniref:spore cortex biosynthesis protein YabQ n=1 Tax=Bacillus sp. FJAT-47783 TaxID=2922712 RepID=UPI001FAD18AA|nr:spore cortex biosynthesis protein YabQ [Bacillus sp. FJAT-47783]